MTLANTRDAAAIATGPKPNTDTRETTTHEYAHQ